MRGCRIVTLTSIVDSLTINGHVQPSDVSSRIVNFHSADNFCASYVSKSNIDEQKPRY